MKIFKDLRSEFFGLAAFTVPAFLLSYAIRRIVVRYVEEKEREEDEKSPSIIEEKLQEMIKNEG